MSQIVIPKNFIQAKSFYAAYQVDDARSTHPVIGRGFSAPRRHVFAENPRLPNQGSSFNSGWDRSPDCGVTRRGRARPAVVRPEFETGFEMKSKAL